ncbi:MAG: MBL fold metallo-hydrolase, partial [Parachlamydiaceae bacterium]
VIDLPGHTPGGVGFYDPKRGLLFSGDTLFQNTIGNLSFPTARPELMWKSLKKLAKLPPETIVMPGHGPSTTIAKERWLDKAEDYFG